MKVNIFFIFVGLMFFGFLRPNRVFAACLWELDECSGTCSAGGACAVVGTACRCVYPPTSTPKPPTSTPPPATATPTPLVCDTTLDGCYPLADDGCESICDDCPVLPAGVSQPRTKSGDCFSSDACREAKPYPLGPCYMYENLEDSFHCGWCTGGGTPMPTPTPFCQPFQCYNVPPENSVCPGFNAAGCPSGLGNCDNCGGVDCGLCPGSTPPAGPTPTPGCTENCFNDPRYLTTCYNDTFGICANTIWCYGSLSATNPDTPVLSNPATGTIVNVNTSVNLEWNAISSWGRGCPNSP